MTATATMIEARPKPKRTRMCRIALRYAARGWRVMPVTQRKTPMLMGGHKVGTTDPRQIRLWWHVCSGRKAIGICTGRQSGIWVMDIDPRSGGNEALAALERKYGPLPETLTARTPSGGTHYYFRYPKPVPKITTTSKKIGPGIDQRGDNGYVVAPGSSVAHGSYEWTSDLVPALAPWWLLKLALFGHRKVTADDRYLIGHRLPQSLAAYLADLPDD